MVRFSGKVFSDRGLFGAELEENLLQVKAT